MISIMYMECLSLLKKITKYFAALQTSLLLAASAKHQVLKSRRAFREARGLAKTLFEFLVKGADIGVASCFGNFLDG